MEIPTLAMIIPSMIIEIDVSSHPLWLIIRIDQKIGSDTSQEGL